MDGIVAGVLAAVAALAGVLLQSGLERRRAAEEQDADAENWVRDRRAEAHLAFLAEASRLVHFISMYTRVGGRGITPDDGGGDGQVDEYGETLSEDWWRPLLARLTPVQVSGRLSLLSPRAKSSTPSNPRRPARSVE